MEELSTLLFNPPIPSTEFCEKGMPSGKKISSVGEVVEEADDDDEKIPKVCKFSSRRKKMVERLNLSYNDMEGLLSNV